MYERNFDLNIYVRPGMVISNTPQLADFEIFQIYISRTRHKSTKSSRTLNQGMKLQPHHNAAGNSNVSRARRTSVQTSRLCITKNRSPLPRRSRFVQHPTSACWRFPVSMLSPPPSWLRKWALLGGTPTRTPSRVAVDSILHATKAT